MKIPGFGAEFGSESVSQRYGSADPDPYQNVTHPATLLSGIMLYRGTFYL